MQLPQFSKRAVDDHTNRLGTFTFASLANYSSNTPYVLTAQQGLGRALYWANEVGAFIQDQIKLTAKLQLSAGLRYDWQTYVSDNNNLAPRWSLAYAPGKGKNFIPSPRLLVSSTTAPAAIFPPRSNSTTASSCIQSSCRTHPTPSQPVRRSLLFPPTSFVLPQTSARLTPSSRALASNANCIRRLPSQSATAIRSR